MLYDGIKLAEGSDAKNLTIVTGTSFPANPNIGEMFYRTDGGNTGVWVYDGSTWQKLGSGAGSFAPLSHVGAGGSEHAVATTSTAGFMSSTDKMKLDAAYHTGNLTFGSGLTYTSGVLSANAIPLPDIVTPGTYKSVTVNAQGLVTAGTNPTTLAGYGITDATPLSHVGTGGAAHAVASTTVAGFMSAADKTKLDGLVIGTSGATLPLLNGTNTWSNTQYFTASPIIIDGASVGQYGQFLGFRVSGETPFTWVQSTETDRDFVLEAVSGATKVSRLRLDHADATGNELFVGATTLTYGGNTVYHAGNLSFGSGLNFNAGVLTATAQTYTAGNGLSLTSGELALTGTFSGNTLYHSGNLSFGSGLTYSGGVLTASGGGGGGGSLNLQAISTNTTMSAGTSYLVTGLGADTAVRALLPLTGANGSTTFTDLTGRTWTRAGNTVITTDQSRFGNGSARFDGSGDYLATTTSAADSISTGNFTIELWARWNTFGTDKKYVVCHPGNGSQYWQFRHDSTAGASFRITGFALVVEQGNNTGWSTGVWYHVAIVRNRNNFTIYRNGISVASATFTGSIGHFANLEVGGASIDLPTSADAWFNDFRFSPGIARYTSNFTPPSQPLSITNDLVEMTLPATVNAGEVFRVRNSSTNSANASVRVVPGASRRIRPFAVAENIIASPGEEIAFVATSNTDLEIIAPQFDPRDVPQSIRNANTTFAMFDRGEMITKTDTSAYTWTIPLESAVNFPIGSTILLMNDGSAGNITVAPTSGVTLLDGATSGNFTLTPGSSRSIIKVGSNRWRVS